MKAEEILGKFEEQLETDAGDIVALRRHLHQFPELSNFEFKTTSLLTDRLKEMGFHVHVRPEGTGFYADLVPPGFDPARQSTVAVRCDLDALPIQELNQTDYASQIPNVMHACGHDVHMSIATGIGMALQGLELPGRLRLLYQHAEESVPGGAREMVEFGAMRDVDWVLGMHVDPELPVGMVGVKSGAFTAAFDTFTITIHGKSGHGARPHHCVDPIFVLTQLANALYNVMDRTFDARDPVVFSIGIIEGGLAPNVIPDTACMKGTIRTLSKSNRDALLGTLNRVADGICSTYGATFTLDFIQGAPAIINDEQVTLAIAQEVQSALGEDALYQIPLPSMGSEDFSVYLEKTPGAMCRIGVARENHPRYFLHSANFDIDERALLYGTRILGRTALKLMSTPSRLREL